MITLSLRENVMKSIIVVILLQFALVWQGIAQECLITHPGSQYNYVYPSASLNLLTGGYVMYNNTMSSYSECGWTAVGVTGKACGVCNAIGLCVAGICACVGTLYTGYEASSFTVVNCSIDNYSWALPIIAALFSYISIRRRNGG